jgi:predicted metal-dependent hydrolase
VIAHSINGISLTVTRKKVKYIRVRIKPDGSVHASLPLKASPQALERFITSKTNWITSVQTRLAAKPAAPILTPQKRQAMLEGLPQRVQHWAGVVGVPIPEVRVRLMKTRWGSCNIPAQRIWLNAQLAAYPPECLDYVIVHELVHFLERGHNKRFYSLMSKAMPEWMNYKKTLDAMR